MRWKLSSQKLSTENQSFWDSLSYNTQKWEHYYNFFKQFCDTDKYEELEMDNDSLYLALFEENL